MSMACVPHQVSTPRSGTDLRLLPRDVRAARANIIVLKHWTENSAKINLFALRFLLKASAKARASLLVASLGVVVGR
jgi:hypothetical protein